MPVVQLPISKGLVTDGNEADWLDSLPVNMVLVPKEVLDANGYMRSWPGLEQTLTVPNVARGGVYNVVLNQVFRIHGTSLVDGQGTVLGDVGGFGLAQMPFSTNSQAIVSDGKLLFYREDQDEITALQNWADDERSNSWVPDFNNSYIEILAFTGVGDVLIEMVLIPELPGGSTDRSILMEDSTTDDDGVALGNTLIYITGDGRVGFKPNAASTEQETDAGFVLDGEIQTLLIGYSITSNEASINIGDFSEILTGFSDDFGQIDTLGSRGDNSIRGQMYEFNFGDVAAPTNNRFYEAIITSEVRPEELTIDTDNADETTQAQEQGTLVNFPNGLEWIRGVFTPTAPTDFVLDNIIDAVRNRSRYIFIQAGSGLFGVTDLTNEQRPDYIAPFYSAESEPDENIAVDAWKGYVVIFGRWTVEYFGLTGSSESIYSSSRALTVRAGIVGRGCKCQYLDSFAILGGPQFEPPSIYLIQQGSYQEIATRRIQKILRSYTIEEIERAAYLEPVKYDGHDFLVVHLPDDVLVYDYNATSEGLFPWTILKSDVDGNTPYRAIYHVHDGDNWTAGDKQEGILTRLNFQNSSHVGQSVEYIVDTPMVQARNKRLYDLEVDNIPGQTTSPHRLAYSVTYDGQNYGQENWLHFDTPLDYRQRILARRLGYTRNNVGFRLRWITDSPSSISNFRVRME